MRTIITGIVILGLKFCGPGHAQDSRVQFTGHAGTVTAMTLSARGDTLATAGRDGTVRFWSVATGVQKQRVRIGGGDAYALEFLGDDRVLMAVPRGLALVASGDGAMLETYPGARTAVTALAVLPDNTAFATGREDGTVVLRDIAERHQIRSLGALPATVTAMTVDDDGQTVAAGDADGTVRLWSRETGMSQTLQGAAAGAVVALDFVAGAPAGPTLASAHAPGSVILWDGDGREMTRFETGYRVRDMAVSPGGSLAVTVGGDGHATLHGLPDGQIIRTFRAHEGTIHATMFVPDGKTLLTGGAPKIALAWPVPPPELRPAAAAETVLGLDDRDWRTVQTALAGAGQDIGPVDGLPGPRTRSGLAGWQRARGDKATGYLTAAQQAALTGGESDAAVDPADSALAQAETDGAQTLAEVAPEADGVSTLRRVLGHAGPEDCHLVVAARRRRAEVARFVNTLDEGLKETFVVAMAQNGWHVISAGVTPRSGFEDLKNALVAAERIPSDAYCTRGLKFRNFNTDVPVFDFIAIE